MSHALKSLFGIRGSNRLRVHPTFAARLGLTGMHRGFVAFGLAKRSVDIIESDDVPEGELQLGRGAIEALRVPDFLPLRVEVRGRGIHLGPYVGIVYDKSDAKLDERFLVTRLRYRTERMNTVTFHSPIGHFGFVQQYDRVGGAVVIFGLDKVNRAEQLIEGYCYDPASDSWRAGTFPYPSCLYRRVGLSESWKSHFLTAMGDVGFNSYFADKWEVAQWLDQNPDLCAHLPESHLYRTFDGLAAMVERHGVVYAKPISGLGGFGVMRIEKEAEQWRFGFREAEVNHDLVYSEEEARAFADEKLGKYEHLVQQGVELKRFEGCLTDIRLLMQKEWGDEWRLQGIIIRQGVPGSVVSNISSGGCAWTMDEFFVERLGWEKGRARGMEARLEALGVAVCDQLDAVGLRLAYVGVDVGITHSDELFIIEVNMRDPDSTIALDVNDKHLYDRLKTGPLIHAAWLSGFGPLDD